MEDRQKAEQGNINAVCSKCGGGVKVGMGSKFISVETCPTCQTNVDITWMDTGGQKHSSLLTAN